MPQTDRAQVCDGAEYKINHFKPPGVLCDLVFWPDSTFQSTENPAAGSLKEETKGLEDQRVGCLQVGSAGNAGDPRQNCGDSSGAQASRLPPPHLRLFRAGDGHEDVVEVGAAPPQHVHPLLAPLLPQLIDGILRARRRERQRGSSHQTEACQAPGMPTPLSGLKPTVPSYYLAWVLTSSPM